MRHIDSTKNKAVELRKFGHSYGYISNQLSVPKSTLSGWFKNEGYSKLAREKNISIARSVAAKNISFYNKKRAKDYGRRVAEEQKRYAVEVKKMSRDEIFFLGIGLFMTEGSRKEKWSVRFVNSDPTIVKIIMKFFRENCEADINKIYARIHIHDDKKYIEALNYWSRIAKIPKDRFWKPQVVVSKSSQYKRQKRLEFGILHIAVCDARLCRKINGWSQGIAMQFEKKI